MKGWRMADKFIWTTLLLFTSLAAALIGALPQTLQAAAADEEIVIVAFGDSLTAGYQLPPDAGFPAQLQAALRAKGLNVRVENAGVSGDTSADALARFDWAMPEKADAAIVELGANDALRGIPLDSTRKALDGILARLKERNMAVLFAGMEAPRNWGQEYTDKFREMFSTLAEKHDTVFYPFFLEGVAMDRTLNLGDGMHPNEAGVKRIVENIMPKVEALIAKVKERRGQPS
jgi:acyl-CoA thioesterase-1